MSGVVWIMSKLEEFGYMMIMLSIVFLVFLSKMIWPIIGLIIVLGWTFNE